MTRTGWQQQRSIVAAAAMAWASVVGSVAAQTPGGGSGRPVFSADVVVDEQVVDGEGTVVETRPSTAYRMTITRGARGLRTEIVYPTARLYPKGPLVDPRSGYRLEFGSRLGDGRVYDAAGALVLGPPDEPDGSVEAPHGATTGLVLSDRDVTARKRELVRKFGQPLGRLSGRDRYLATVDNLLTETLVEPATNLPVEVNVARDGALAERTAIAYARMPGGRWYVARTRSELALPGASGRRFVSIRTHTNVESQEAR